MKRWTPLLFLPMLLAACSRTPDIGTETTARTIEVSIGSDSRLDISTRTALDSDGETVKWQNNDQIALWAVNSASQTVLDKSVFSLYHYNTTYENASFRGSIPEMEDDTYTYYAVSPVPASTDGLKVSYDIPTVQDGKFHGEWDVMVASPIVGAKALREHDRKDESGISDNSDIVNLQFNHKVHVLKITIPQNNLGEPVSEINLTFPVPVTGRLTVDAADPAAEGVLKGVNREVILRFDSPKNAGDVVYAMIAPISLEEGQTISIVAVGETCESESRTFVPTTADRTFAAGHTTPINYHVPGVGRIFTQMIFRLTETGANTLGEEINTFTITSPQGWVFADGSRAQEFKVTGTGDYTVRFREYPNTTESLDGFTVIYDSEHARLTESFTMPEISVDRQNLAYTFRVPYLFEEDFSNTTTHSNNGGMSDTGHDTQTEWGDSWGLPGWSGNQWHIEGGKTLAIRHQAERVWLLGTYRGRVDARQITGLKAAQKVYVKFNYTGRNNKGGTPVLNYGYTTKADALFGYYEGGSSFVSRGETIEFLAGTVNAPTNGSVENLDPNTAPSIEFTIENCNNGYRLSWDCFVENAPSFNSQQWVILDNIRVSLAPIQ